MDCGGSIAGAARGVKIKPVAAVSSGRTTRILCVDINCLAVYKCVVQKIYSAEFRQKIVSLHISAYFKVA